MIGARVIGCDANMESEDLDKSIWFQLMGAVIAAREDEAGIWRANVARRLSHMKL